MRRARFGPSGPLRAMGAGIDAREGRFAPVTVRGAALSGIDYTLPVASARRRRPSCPSPWKEYGDDRGL